MRLIDADALKEEVSSLRMVITGLRCGKGVLSEYAREHLKSILRIIDESPTIDAEPVRHGRWEETSKHEWKKYDDGSVDELAFEYDYHNGPVCEICGFSFCEHCNPNSWDDDGCKKRYVCSECGRTEKNKEPYCNCGAKMDAKEDEP